MIICFELNSYALEIIMCCFKLFSGIICEKGSDALSGKMLLVRIIENKKKLCLF